MIYVYLFSLIVGGILLGSSVFLGAHGDGHADVHADPGEPAFEHDAAGAESLLALFLSVRFWMFFAAFFGLTGLLFTAMGLLPWWWAIGLISLGVGVAAGGGAALLLREAAGRQSNSSATTKDLVGKTARVMVAFGPGETGKVRLETKGTTQELLAVSVDETRFDLKEEAQIVAIEGTRARVARVDER